MQYAPDDTSAPAMRPMQRIRKRMLDGMGGDPSVDPVNVGVNEPLMGPNGPASGNTGIGGGMAQPRKPPVSVPDFAEPAAQAAPAAPAAPPRVSADNAQHALMQAVNDNLGTIRSAQGDAARKAAVEQVLRGVNADGIEEIRGEKVRIGGKWIDLLQDVEGAAIPQWLVEEEQQQAAGMPSAQRGIDPMAGSQRGMDTAQTSLIDQIRASIMQLMGQGKQG